MFFCKFSRFSTFLLGPSSLTYVVVLLFSYYYLLLLFSLLVLLLSLLSSSLFGLVLLFAAFCVFLSAFLALFRLFLLTLFVFSFSLSLFCFCFFFLLIFFLLFYLLFCLGSLFFCNFLLQRKVHFGPEHVCAKAPPFFQSPGECRQCMHLSWFWGASAKMGSYANKVSTRLGLLVKQSVRRQNQV